MKNRRAKKLLTGILAFVGGLIVLVLAAIGILQIRTHTVLDD